MPNSYDVKALKSDYSGNETITRVDYGKVYDATALKALFDENNIPPYARLPIFISTISKDKVGNTRAVSICPVMQP